MSVYCEIFGVIFTVCVKHLQLKMNSLVRARGQLCRTSAYCYIRIWLRCESEHHLWLCQHMVMSAVATSADFHVIMFVVLENIVMSEECL